MRTKKFRNLHRDIIMDAVIEAGERLRRHGKLPEFLAYTLDKDRLDYETDRALDALNDSYRNRIFLDKIDLKEAKK